MSPDANLDDCGVFLAKLSTGDWLLENVHLAGALSPWQQLMERCHRESLSLTDLRLNCGGFLVETKPNAPGYFFAVKLFRGVGVSSGWESDDLAYKGVGWVTADRQCVEIIWASRRLLARCSHCAFTVKILSAIAPRPCERCQHGQIKTAPDAWRETRSIRGNMNVLWSDPAESGRERDVVIYDGHLWVPGAHDAPQRADLRR